MKKLIYIVITLMVVCIVSCNTTSSSDGDLDNFWYLIQVDTLSTGNSVAYRGNRIFWSFQGTLMQAERAGSTQFICYFQKKDNTIYQNQLYLSDRTKGDVLITPDMITSYNIYKYGINQPIDTFTVDTLNSDRMVLHDRLLRLHFERY